MPVILTRRAALVGLGSIILPHPSAAPAMDLLGGVTHKDPSLPRDGAERWR